MTTRSTDLPKIFSISSGKGGVGKTSFTVNIAVALAGQGHKILLLDGDLGLANVDVVLGLNVRRTIRDTVEDGRPLAEAIVPVSPNFDVLPASSGVPEMASLPYEEQVLLTSNLEGVINGYDFVLIDTAAGLGESVLWFNNWAGENIIILSPDPTSMTDAYALIKVLCSRHDKNRFQMVINNVKSRKEGESVFNSMRQVLERFLRITPRFLGAMPQDGSVTRAVRAQRPFLISEPEARASRAVRQMAAAIINLEQFTDRKTKNNV